MSTYTTTLNEVMKDINHHNPKPIPELIENSRAKIFDFDYVTPTSIDEAEFKKMFETMFLTKFALWEIGFDTFEQFHLQLWSKCIRILPTYSVKIDTLIKLKNISPKQFFSVKQGTENNVNTNNIDNKNVHSTLPSNLISTGSLGKTEYADDGSYNENKSKGSSDTTYDLVYGNYIDSLKTFTKLLDYDFIKIYDDLLNEFNYLFLGVM